MQYEIVIPDKIQRIIDLLRNNLEKLGERISVKRSIMRGAMDALEGSIL
ncbi:hypothetical protein C5S29_15150 [ANME-1 cluster archaeon GoMg3.2]|nr:hypothetical protein [ANME-1 cluster archaeon GoMg3.2]